MHQIIHIALPDFWTYTLNRLMKLWQVDSSLWSVQRFYQPLTRLSGFTSILEHLMFLMEFSAIFLIYTVSYGTIAGTWTPAIPPFEPPFFESRRYLWFILSLMGLSPVSDYRRYPHLDFSIRYIYIYITSAPFSRTFLMFLMGLPAIFINGTVSYGTIAGTYLPDTPPFNRF